ncbi:MAG: DUF2461 domain-containing protein [Pseudomonadota bacterium]
MTGFTQDSFKFLAGLKSNNDRDWFNDNKSVFTTKLEAPFAELLEALSDRLSDALQPLRGGKSTMFRMNRDVRFSNDKSPYKTAVSGLLTPSGKKAEANGVCYVHLDATGGFSAVGYYSLSPKQLGPMRDAIIDRADEFDDVMAKLKRAKRRLSDDDMLSAMPRGFSQHADHRHADALKLKSLMIVETLPKSAWLSGDVVDRIEKLARDGMPLLTFAQPAC